MHVPRAERHRPPYRREALGVSETARRGAGGVVRRRPRSVHGLRDRPRRGDISWSATLPPCSMRTSCFRPCDSLSRMAWPRDDAKLERVRALMAEQELDALVVRAPDNVLYLTNFWGMKGYDAVVFPREGEPTLVCLEASAEDAARTAWTRTSGSSRLRRARPAAAARARARPRAGRPRARFGTDRARALARHAGRRPHGRRADDVHARLVRRLRRRPRDATPLLAEARAIKTEQELERMRLANEIAALRDGARRATSCGRG